MRSSSALLSAVLLAAPCLAQGYIPLDPPAERVAEGIRFDDVFQVVRPDGTIQEFSRCGTPNDDLWIENFGPEAPDDGGTADCDGSSDPTQIGGAPPTIYDPEHHGSYLVDVWVHVIENAGGTLGDVPVAEIYEQLAVLAEDFRAIPGSNGAAGSDMRLFFRLKGFEVSNNTTWYNDGGAYYNTLAVTPATVVNVYTNSAGGNLGYVPFLPHTNPGGIGTSSDRVVIYWEAFGRNRGLMPQYDLGRSLTHELGHYFGLPHTFEGCVDATNPACFANGDLICDTPPEGSPNFGCPASRDTCPAQPGQDPIHNYMDYSDDPCMNQFTLQQGRRERCTIEHYRGGLLQPVLFYDDWETGNTQAWDVPFVP